MGPGVCSLCALSHSVHHQAILHHVEILLPRREAASPIVPATMIAVEVPLPASSPVPATLPAVMARAFVPSLNEGIGADPFICEHEGVRSFLADVFDLATAWHHLDAKAL